MIKNIGLKREIREFLVKNFFQIWFQQIRKTFIMPSARIVCFDKISKTHADILLQALQKDGRNNIEVVFHPALTADNPVFGNISTERVKEYEFVSSKEVFEKYISKGFEFVNFDSIN